MAPCRPHPRSVCIPGQMQRALLLCFWNLLTEPSFMQRPIQMSMPPPILPKCTTIIADIHAGEIHAAHQPHHAQNCQPPFNHHRPTRNCPSPSCAFVLALNHNEQLHPLDPSHSTSLIHPCQAAISPAPAAPDTTSCSFSILMLEPQPWQMPS